MCADVVNAADIRVFGGKQSRLWSAKSTVTVCTFALHFTG